MDSKNKIEKISLDISNYWTSNDFLTEANKNCGTLVAFDWKEGYLAEINTNVDLSALECENFKFDTFVNFLKKNNFTSVLGLPNVVGGPDKVWTDKLKETLKSNEIDYDEYIVNKWPSPIPEFDVSDNIFILRYSFDEDSKVDTLAASQYLFEEFMKRSDWKKYYKDVDSEEKTRVIIFINDIENLILHGSFDNLVYLPTEWNLIFPGYWSNNTMDAWIGQPIESNKFLLVSWRMSGSEFCKELIRENYPETTPVNYWAKSHIILDDKVTRNLIDIADTKVFVVITDPREVAMNLVYFDNGRHGLESDYEIGTLTNHDSVQFLNEVADKQIDLINHYNKVFGDNCIVLRYEDAFHYQDKFLDRVSNFLGSEPLKIDDVRKYKWSIYKNVGDFNNFFDEDVLIEHYNEYRWFYEKWGYPNQGLQLLKYNWHVGHPDVSNRQLTEDYKEMLKRNGVQPSDRTRDINEF